MPDHRHRHPDFTPTDPPPRKVMGVEIREKRDEAAPSSISASGLLGWAARNGRSWNPIGVSMMLLLIGAGAVYALNTDQVKALVAAWKDNTAAVERLEARMTKLEAKADEALAGNKAIREELKVQGQGNATVRIVRLEHNDKITGQFLTELNGKRPNDSFPRADKDDFQRAPDLPPFDPPLFVTKQQWAIKPE